MYQEQWYQELNHAQEKLLVKIEPSEPPQPPTLEEYIRYSYQNFGPPPINYSLLEFLDEFAWYQEQWYQELNHAQEKLLVKREPTLEEYIRYFYQNFGPPPVNYLLFEFLDGFAWYQEQWYRELNHKQVYFFEHYLIGDWRKGKEMHKVVITQRFYQTVEGSTKA